MQDTFNWCNVNGVAINGTFSSEIVANWRILLHRLTTLKDKYPEYVNNLIPLADFQVAENVTNCTFC